MGLDGVRQLRDLHTEAPSSPRALEGRNTASTSCMWPVESRGLLQTTPLGGGGVMTSLAEQRVRETIVL